MNLFVAECVALEVPLAALKNLKSYPILKMQCMVKVLIKWIITENVFIQTRLKMLFPITTFTIKGHPPTSKYTLLKFSSVTNN